MRALKQSYLPKGAADTPGKPGSGSRVFELNLLMWRWPRPGWGVPYESGPAHAND